MLKDFEGKIILEYSPESFTGTEVDYALEVCDAVVMLGEHLKIIRLL